MQSQIRNAWGGWCTAIMALSAWPMAAGGVSLRACAPGGQTAYPLEDVMVGSDLVLIVGSDQADIWSGGLFVSGRERAAGTLYGRGYNPAGMDYAASHLAPAGEYAKVLGWHDSFIWGFDFYTSEGPEVVAGDWFVLDYHADTLGECTVRFYDHIAGWNSPDPNLSLTFSHVRTRDFNNDGRVNARDYATLASSWLRTGPTDPNYALAADLDCSGRVDLSDLGLFLDFWLWGTPTWQPRPESVPDVLYRVADAYGRREITMRVGQTATLYVDMVSLGGTVQIFDLEVDISNTARGSIDNRPYDSQYPQNSTARILAVPSNLIYYGPGWNQAQGLEFVAASFSGPMQQGHLASFQYTATAAGDVRLYLANLGPYRALAFEDIVIHQEVNP